jgi:hypothetical protein
MDSRHVTADQARAITRWVEPTVQRLTALLRRMDERGFPQTDRLYVRVVCAREALAHLNGGLSAYNDPCYFPQPLAGERPPAR